MKFARFDSFLSFLSSYSTVERALLDKELAVAKYLKQNPWLSAVPKAQPEIKSFLDIQMNRAVREDEYFSIAVELDSILQNLKNFTGKADRAFDNRQPDALVIEIRNHLANRRAARQNPGQANLAKVISYKADLRNHKAANFHAMMATRQQVLWTLDTEGYLSIGDPNGNKHSVVAVGKTVLGAGLARLKIEARDDAYFSALDQRQRAKECRRMAAASGITDKDKQVYLENADMMDQMAKAYEEELGSYRPSSKSLRLVELDFDSGHYAPREAWRPSTKAWNEAGYEVVWSSTSKFV